MTRVGGVQTDHHTSWAPEIPAPEGNPTSSHTVACRMSPRPTRRRNEIQTFFVFLEARRAASGPNAIARHRRQPVFRVMTALSCHCARECVHTYSCRSPHLLTHPDQFAAGSTQSSVFCLPQRATPTFLSVWTMKYFIRVHCELRLPRAMVVQSDLMSAPSPAVMPDRPRPPAPFKTAPCPFASSGNTNLPCLHISCSPPLDVRLLSRRLVENASGSGLAETPSLLSITGIVVVRLLILHYVVPRYSPTNADP